MREDSHWLRAILHADAVVFFGIGAVALAWPRAFGQHAGGIGFATCGAMSDFRAVYGGMQCALGVAFALAARREKTLRPGLLLAALVLGGLVAGRTLGVIVNGHADQRTLVLLTPELAGLAINLWALRAPPGYRFGRNRCP